MRSPTQSQAERRPRDDRSRSSCRCTTTAAPRGGSARGRSPRLAGLGGGRRIHGRRRRRPRSRAGGAGAATPGQPRQGRGPALRVRGRSRARGLGDHLDADGQHDAQDVPGLIASIPAGQRPIVVGRRQRMAAEAPRGPAASGAGSPTSGSAWPRAPGARQPERLPHLSAPEVLALDVCARRYQFEVEVLVRAAWAGLR